MIAIERIMGSLYTMNMGLETVFYTLGIITMGLFLLLLLVIIAMIIHVKTRIDAFKAGFAGKVMGILQERNMEIASALGLTVAHFFLDRVKDTIDSKRKKKS